MKPIEIAQCIQLIISQHRIIAREGAEGPVKYEVALVYFLRYFFKVLIDQAGV